LSSPVLLSLPAGGNTWFFSFSPRRRHLALPFPSSMVTPGSSSSFGLVVASLRSLSFSLVGGHKGDAGDGMPG
ncbi:hypothetical protein U1Q18_005398, partial [Sarracenia purpurea var. burkii]